MENPQRPVVLVRSEYKPNQPFEEFIVRLLAAQIEDCLQNHIGAGNGNKALDAGCGRQPFRQRIESLGFRYHSTDVNQSPEQSVDVVCAIDEQLPPELVAMGPFQFILCTEVLEHVADWRQAFANLWQLLEPGGRVLLTIPFVYQLHEIPYDFWRPTIYAIEHFARKSGLEPVHIAKAGSGWDVLGTVVTSLHASPKSNKLFDRFAAFVVRKGSRLLFKCLRRELIQRHVELSGGIYQSNVVVLRKPG